LNSSDSFLFKDDNSAFLVINFVSVVIQPLM